MQGKSAGSNDEIREMIERCRAWDVGCLPGRIVDEEGRWRLSEPLVI